MRAGVPTSVLTVNESIFEMLKKSEIFFKNGDKTNSAKVFDKIRTQALAIAEKYEMEAATTTSLQTGAVEMLKELKAMNLKIGLCTTNSEKAAKYILQRFKIEDYFKTIVSRDKVKYVKPHTEQFELALKALSAQAQGTVIVGDSVVDMQSAKELKAIAVGIPTGTATLEQLKKASSNFIVTSLSDLPMLIKEINKT
jgi:pyrophosphatase PpaX